MKRLSALGPALSDVQLYKNVKLAFRLAVGILRLPFTASLFRVEIVGESRLLVHEVRFLEDERLQNQESPVAYTRLRTKLRSRRPIEINFMPRSTSTSSDCGVQVTSSLALDSFEFELNQSSSRHLAS